MSKSSGGIDLDAILDQALEDFEADELTTKASKVEDSHAEGSVQERERERLMQEQHLASLMAGMTDERFGSTLQSTLKSLSQTSEGNENGV